MSWKEHKRTCPIQPSSASPASSRTTPDIKSQAPSTPMHTTPHSSLKLWPLASSWCCRLDWLCWSALITIYPRPTPTETITTLLNPRHTPSPLMHITIFTLREDLQRRALVSTQFGSPQYLAYNQYSTKLWNGREGKEKTRNKHKRRCRS